MKTIKDNKTECLRSTQNVTRLRRAIFRPAINIKMKNRLGRKIHLYFPSARTIEDPLSPGYVRWGGTANASHLAGACHGQAGVVNGVEITSEMPSLKLACAGLNHPTRCLRKHRLWRRGVTSLRNTHHGNENDEPAIWCLDVRMGVKWCEAWKCLGS